MKLIDLLIFDLDGTLADTRQDLTDAVNHALEYFKFPKRSVKEVSKYIGGGAELMLRRSFGTDTGYDMKKAVKLALTYYSKHLVDNTVLYTGIKEILGYYQNKHIVVVTNKMRKYSEPILSHLGVLDLFDFILGYEDVDKHKPAPYPLLLVSKKIKIKPSRSVIIGDSPEDVAAGKSAGMTTVAVTYGLNSKKVLRDCKPDFFVNDITEIKKCFK